MTDDLDLAGSTDPSGRDDPLLSELRVLARQVTPVPDEIVTAARASFCWRRIDAELASLAFDSLVDHEGSNLVRAESGPRLLSFEGPGLSIEIEVTTTPTARRVVGQLVPPGPGTVEFRHSGGTITVDADQAGRFRADGIAAGTVSLRCEVPGAPTPAVETAWVLI